MTETKLKVAEAIQDDVNKGIVRIDSGFMRDIEAKPGDILEIEGGRKTVAIVDRSYPGDIGLNIIRMDGLARKNSKTSIGEIVKVTKATIKEAKKVVVAPAKEGVFVRMPPNIFKQGLLGRAVVKGDIIALGGARNRRITMAGNPYDEMFNIINESIMGGVGLGFGDLKFIVADVNPKTPVIITNTTEIILNPEAINVEEETVPDISYEDVGGLDEEVSKIREMVELPLKHPEIFERLGVEPPKGVLLHGPPGTGKTLLAKAVANETNAHFILINGPEIVSKFYGESEKNLRDKFTEAEKNSPSIIFFDEIDAIASKREETRGEVEKRIVAQLLSLMDGLKTRGKVVVIAATNIPNSLDPALRRPGRFDRELSISVPNKEGRLNILKIHTRNMPFSKDVKLKEIASITHGFVGADMASLAKEAAMVRLREVIPDLQQYDKDEQIPKEVLEKLFIKHSDFKNALRVVRPSALREVLVESPNVRWTDIGGLEGTKEQLKESIEWPLKYAESFKRLGIRPPRGVLLYGPPGTGKTMLAKAIATESEANFISVKGPSLLSMWVGESLPYKEELLVKHNGIIKRMKIGEVVENKIDVEVLAFNKDKKIRFAKINDYIKHPLTGKLLEIKTRTGRRIVVTDYHSVFSFINGIFTDVPASHLIKGESYVAIPKNLNMPEEKLRSINLYNHFKKDGDIYVSKVKEYIERAKKILGLERTAKSLKISKKYVADIIGKNLPVPINLFDNLIKEAKLALTPEEIKIKLKGSVHEYPAIFNIEEDFWRLLGIWIAEGDLNGHTVRIHNQNHAIRQDIINTCKKYNIYISEMETCITLNSRFLQKVFKKVFGMESGANKKRLPTISFTIDKKSKSEMLKGYFSGDGSIYSSRDGKFKIEVGTISKDLANDLMYMLLDFGIVATCYEKPERTGTTTYRISILGVKNFEIFKDIGFIDRKRDKKITQYIESRNWCRSDLIPLSGELYELASQQNKVYSTNYSIGKEKLKSMLVLVDKEKTKYKEYWDLVMGDIFFDMVKEIKVIEGEQYVYDISVPEGQNFIGGFGGIIAHNSERGVRKIFEKARQASPSIIFFDEIDALAPRRGAGTDNHATERVVNQLLTEMDGLDSLQDVVIIAATNRPDIIDPALLRPGRFDRILLTPPPDINGRTEILKVHTAKMPLSQDVNIQEIAEKTEGFVGADIEALCREAAMISLREDMKTKEVSKKHFEEALKIVRPSVTPDITKVYEEIEGQFKGALAKQVKENMPNYFG